MLVAVFILVNLKRGNEQWLELHLTLMGQTLNFTEADSAALGRRCCIFLRSEIGHPQPTFQPPTQISPSPTTPQMVPPQSVPRAGESFPQTASEHHESLRLSTQMVSKNYFNRPTSYFTTYGFIIISIGESFSQYADLKGAGVS